MQPHIQQIYIPCKVSKITSDAFAHCTSLSKLVFASNSTLETIERNSF